jgi:cation transport ATPase
VSVHINLWAVLLAGVASMVVGFIYYMPNVLGKVWMKLAKVDEKRFQKEMPQVMPGVFIAALVTAYVMAQFMYVEHAFYHAGWMSDALLTAVLAWLGFSFTTIFVHNALDQRPARLTYIAWGNRFLSFLAMGLILGWLHP